MASMGRPASGRDGLAGLDLRVATLARRRGYGSGRSYPVHGARLLLEN
jgi:hypothetical protein